MLKSLSSALNFIQMVLLFTIRNVWTKMLQIQNTAVQCIYAVSAAILIISGPDFWCLNATHRMHGGGGGGGVWRETELSQVARGFQGDHRWLGHTSVVRAPAVQARSSGFKLASPILNTVK